MRGRGDRAMLDGCLFYLEAYTCRGDTGEGSRVGLVEERSLSEGLGTAFLGLNISSNPSG